MKYFSVKDLDVQGKKVLVRVDFNVPLKDGVIKNDKRIVAALPTITYLLDQGASVILMSHLGRPKGEIVDSLRMDPVAECLSTHLGKQVQKLDECVGDSVRAAVDAMQSGDVILLENLRFHKEEKKNDETFAKELASYADLYVNDAFGTCHRSHASVDGVTHHLQSAAGLLVEKEIECMMPVVTNPQKPYVAILGGAKISDKLTLVKKLLPQVDRMLLGGAMIFTFFKAQGVDVGRSLVEEEFIPEALELLKEFGMKIVLPIDIVAAHRIAEDTSIKTVMFDQIGIDRMGLDIGPDSVKLFETIIAGAKTILWNGPMGVFEVAPFAQGTEGVANAVANADCTSIIGGGDSASAVIKLGLADKMTHISTGGGASLELFESSTLPALECLSKSYERFS